MKYTLCRLNSLILIFISDTACFLLIHNIAIIMHPLCRQLGPGRFMMLN